MTLKLEHGVWGVLPTPFTEGLHIDYESIPSLVGYYLQRGVTGIVALGVFGEAGSLSVDEQQEVLSRVSSAASGVPLVVGLSASTTAPGVEMSQRLVEASPGCVAVMVKVPSSGVELTARHFAAIADATGKSVVAQDYPMSTGVAITPMKLLRACELSGVVSAIKAEAPPTSVAVGRLVPETSTPVFGGLGGIGLIDELGQGAAGAMTGFSHPEGLREAVEGFREGGVVGATRAFAPWLPLANFEGQMHIGLALRKEILRRRGALACSAVRPPAHPLPPELDALIAHHLEHARGGTSWT